MITKRSKRLAVDRGSAGHSALQERVRNLADRVRQQGAARMARWQPMIERQSFRPAAENLASYLALRSEDLSELQLDLSEAGLSSLGRCEANVLANLDAVAAALARMTDTQSSTLPPAGWKRARDVPLQEQVEAIFGRDPSGPRSRIMVTLGIDASDAFDEAGGHAGNNHALEDVAENIALAETAEPIERERRVEECDLPDRGGRTTGRRDGAPLPGRAGAPSGYRSSSPRGASGS